MATAVRALFCSGCMGVFFLGSWREVAGMTVRKRTVLVVVCGFGALRYMFFVTCPADMDPGSGSGMTNSWIPDLVRDDKFVNWGQIPIVSCAQSS
jgi:hypothetical protein